MSGALAVLFSDQLNQDELIGQLFESGITPAIVLVCSSIDLAKAEQVIQKYAQGGVEVLSLEGPGTPGTVASIWNPTVPIAPAQTNILPDTDIVLFDRSFSTFAQFAKQVPEGKTLYLFDPFDFMALNRKQPAMKEMLDGLKEKNVTIKSFTFHTDKELIEFVSNKSVALGSQDMAMLLGALVENPAVTTQRALAMEADIRAMLHAKFPIVQQPTLEEAIKKTMQVVPELPEGLKHAEANGS
jgi:hypothetical protein